MALPAAATAAKQVVSKIPRGVLIRAAADISKAKEKEEPQRHPIPFPVFLMILGFSLILDLVLTPIPAIGTAMELIFGSALWIFYFLVGAKGIATLVRILVLIIMSSAFIAELLPGIQVLPINTIVAIIVYIIMSPKVASVIEKPVKLVGMKGAVSAGKKIFSVVKPLVK
jgi:hypothetical protein